MAIHGPTEQKQSAPHHDDAKGRRGDQWPGWPELRRNSDFIYADRGAGSDSHGAKEAYE
jgi:hypothetical protein